MRLGLRSLIVVLIIYSLTLSNLVAAAGCCDPIPRAPAEDITLENTELGTPIDSDKPKLVKSEKIKGEDIVKEFDEKKKTDKKIKALDSFLKQKGFSQAKTKPENNTFGQKDTIKIKNENGVDQEAVSILKINDYKKEGSNDTAAIAEAELVLGEERWVYSFVLIAPDGDLSQTAHPAASSGACSRRSSAI